VRVSVGVTIGNPEVDSHIPQRDLSAVLCIETKFKFLNASFLYCQDETKTLRGLCFHMFTETQSQPEAKVFRPCLKAVLGVSELE